MFLACKFCERSGETWRDSSRPEVPIRCDVRATGSVWNHKRKRDSVRPKRHSAETAGRLREQSECGDLKQSDERLRYALVTDRCHKLLQNKQYAGILQPRTLS